MSRSGGLSWRNHTGNQRCHPAAIERLRAAGADDRLRELVELVRRAERKDGRVRAVGAGHAWSDVALTDGILIEPAEGDVPALLPFDDGTIRTEHGRDRLVRVRADAHLHQLNAALDDEGLALPNMGGYDAQTIAGVVSTSTHGSGLEFGPFPDLVASLDLVVARGEVVRVEPADGPTDAAAFEALHGSRRRLIQDDERFAAAVCGIGCMGLLHSLVLRVREKFWLNEVRTVDSWEAIRDELTEHGVLGKHDHYELFLNPYPNKAGEHPLLVTIRTPHPGPARLPQDKLERHPLTELQSAFPGTWIAVRLGARLFPSLLARGFDWLLKRMRDDGYAGPSFRVFNIGEANKIPAYSSELAVSVDDGSHIEAVDRIIAIAAEQRRNRRRFHTSPIALRFVAPSKAYASMMYGRPTMMIELIMAKGTRGGFELLGHYERELADLGVRPHWGQYNELSTESDLRALYPRWDAWLETYREFNATGVFNSPFTDRIGISQP